MRREHASTFSGGPAAVDLVALQGHVRRLAEDIGERNVFRPEALARAARYIEDVWLAQGYSVATQEYRAAGTVCANLEATRWGTARRDEILLVGAHYDSVAGSPGANDNASGVAAMLELSRLFRVVEPDLTVRFVAFVNEEPPFFAGPHMGSAVYAEAARRRGDDIRLMAALETIGYFSDEPESQHYPLPFSLFYPDRANFIGLVSDLRSRGAMRRLARLFRAHSAFPLEHVATFRFVPGIDWSDHVSFWDQGYRAVMVTDTALYRYPWYHTAGDTPDRLSYPAFAGAADALFRAFAAYAGAVVAGPGD